MIKGLMALVLIVFLISEISSQCNSTQININTANLTELDKITQIGPAKAQAIIDSRPFYSVDDLIKVSGIGNITLNKIKIEGLACVDENNVPQNTEIDNNSPDETSYTTNNSQITSTKTTITTNTITNNPSVNAPNNINLTPIALNIKSENNNENLGKDLALGGIITFCVLFGGLFLLKTIRKEKKNEFR